MVKVAVLGASPKKERYSNMALNQLRDAGHGVTGVNPAHDEIDGVRVVPSVADVDRDTHTVSVYVGPHRIGEHIEDIVNLKPERVIMNPGAESDELAEALDAAGIPWQHACTLVMLRSKLF